MLDQPSHRGGRSGGHPFCSPFASTPQAARRLPKEPEGTPGHFYRLRLHTDRIEVVATRPARNVTQTYPYNAPEWRPICGPVNTTAIDTITTFFPWGQRCASLGGYIDGIRWHQNGAQFYKRREGAMHRADDIEQDAAGDATPATVGLPGLTFEPLLGIDLALAQRVGGQAVALCVATSRAWAGQNARAPSHLGRANDLALARPIFQGLEFRRP